jgi:hypothetical protein
MNMNVTYKLYIVTDWHWMGGADKLPVVRSYSRESSSSRHSTAVKWNLYLKDMGMILFAFHLARENIEQLASTNGVVQVRWSS